MRKFVQLYNGEMAPEKNINPQAFEGKPRWYEAKEVDDFILELPQEYWNVFNVWGSGI